MAMKTGSSGSWSSGDGASARKDAAGDRDFEEQLLQLAYRVGRAAAIGWREQIAARGEAPLAEADCADAQDERTNYRDHAKTPYLSCVQAAEYLGLARATLDRLRVVGGGPKFRKHGRRIHYHVEDLDAWSNERAKHSTSQL